MLLVPKVTDELHLGLERDYLLVEVSEVEVRVDLEVVLGDQFCDLLLELLYLGVDLLL